MSSRMNKLEAFTWITISDYKAEKIRRSTEWDRLLCYGKLPWVTKKTVFLAVVHPHFDNWSIDGVYAETRLRFESNIVTHLMPLPKSPLE